VIGAAVGVAVVVFLYPDVPASAEAVVVPHSAPEAARSDPGHESP
jgi:hypothetical protein